MGVELETYSIALPERRICRELHFPKRASIEKGERFTRDWSIGSEYNSKVFTSIRQAFFLLKSSLRKYLAFRDPENGSDTKYVIFPTGGWIDRFAGSHVHLAVDAKRFSYVEAQKLSTYIHDHIPFLIVLTASSPVWREEMTPYSSNRLLKGSHKYCQVTKRDFLYKHHFRELTFNRSSKKKPNTLEVRVCDSSIPEYLTAVLCVCKAVAERWKKHKRALTRTKHVNYLKARDNAIKNGARARLVWNNHWVSVADYTDLFFRKYEDELDQMDIPDDIIRIFKYLKKGWNQAELIRKTAVNARRFHRQTWQRRFAKKYAAAIEDLLDGNSFEQFAKHLGVRLPSIERTWLGRREANW